MMIPAVVLAVLLVTPTLSLPVTTQDLFTAGTQGSQQIVGNKGYINPQATTGEKGQIEGVALTSTNGADEGSFAEASPAKTGAEEVPGGVIQNVDKVYSEDYSGSGQAGEAVITRGHSNTLAQYSGSGTGSEAERTEVQVPSDNHQYAENHSQNAPLIKGENVAVNNEQKQPHRPDSPLLLPIQPLTVVPVNQVGEFLEPVVVPGEVVTAGRVILMAIKPIQQRNFQDVSALPEKHFPYQQVTQAVTYDPEQAQATGFGQPVEKEEVQRGGQGLSPVQPNQVPFVKEQNVQNPVEPGSNYVPVSSAAPNPQTYSVQPVQPAVNEYVQKQVSPQSTDYTPGQTQFAESTLPQQQTYNVQQPIEKQGAFQQTGYDAVPRQVQALYQQESNPVAVDGVQSHQPYQVGQSVQKRVSDPSHQQQSAERQTSYQQTSDYVPVQNQPSVQQVYSVQPEGQQNYVPVEPVQQKLSGGQSGYQENYIPVQPQSVEQTQTASGEKQLPPQPVQNAPYVHVHPQEPIHQQQVSNVQSFAAVPSASQVPVQPVQPEVNEYVPQQLHKTTGEQSNRVVGAQPPQIVNYAEPIYNFGDKIPQNPAVQQNSPFVSCQQ